MNFRPYSYGPRKWDDYVLQVQEEVHKGTQVQVRTLELQHKLLEESHLQSQELGQQTELLYQQGRDLYRIVEEIQEMREEIQWGFNLVADQMERQIQLFVRMSETLDSINQTLRSPLITQAKELFDLGEDRFRKQLYDKALDAYKKSEEKDEVNPLLQLRMGTILLEGRNHEMNVIDVPSAEQHFLLAARYARTEEKGDSDSSILRDEAHYRAGIAAYA